MYYVNELIETTISTIKDHIVQKTLPCGPFVYTLCDYKSGNAVPVPDETWKPFVNGIPVDCGKHLWAVGTATTPETIPDDCYCVIDFPKADSTQHTILYVNGKATAGLDANHLCVPLEPNKTYDIAIYVYFQYGHNQMLIPTIKLKSKSVEKAYFDFQVPFDAALCFGPKDKEQITIFNHLEAACLMIDKTRMYRPEFYESLKKADEYLVEEFYNKECGKDDLTVGVLGHSHIDVAWHWTIEQTAEKVQRTFSTVTNLMDRYKDFNFMMSQPQLYAFLKKEDPELYAEVKKRVAEGRWEIEGAMWLEPDANIPSGESFVRQLIHGKKFIREEFGKESETLWLPDVFGYSAALPQILKKAGVKYFVTGKISWSDVDDAPYDSFYWKGIDGSEIFSHYLTNKDFFIDSYFPNKTHEYVMFNGNLDPREVKSTYDVYRCKNWNDATLHTFGFGDGGGGPTYEMLERYERMKKGIPGIPKVKMTTLDEFLNTMKTNFDANAKKLRETPKWDGELYLEYHRGALTSVCKVKKDNRRAEFGLRKAEMLSVLNKKFNGAEYPSETFEHLWGLMNLNQFHDILPGTCDKPIYKRTDKEFGEIIDKSNSIANNSLSAIAGNIKTDGGILVYNENSDIGKGIVKYGEKVYTTENIPPLGYTVVDKLYDDNHTAIDLTEGNMSMENEYFRVEYNEMGYMKSIFDKREKRELVREGSVANEIMTYEDYPYHWQSHELSHYTRLKPHPMEKLVSATPYRNGAAAGITFTWSIMNMTVTENVIMYDNIDRIDIEAEVTQCSADLVVKALFPFDIRATKNTSEIQFGHIERNMHMNTSWDEAKFETCMHKWVDVSDTGYGVSILNDCKYGYSSYDNTLAITLLKTYSEKQFADEGRKTTLTYSIYPHKYNPVLGGTVQEAYRLNAPLTAIDVKPNKKGSLPSSYSLIECDRKNLIFDTVKQAENGDGTVIRIYDSGNMQTNAKIKFNFNVKEAYIVNLLEEEPQKIDVVDNSVELTVKAFEIVTLLLK